MKRGLKGRKRVATANADAQAQLGKAPKQPRKMIAEGGFQAEGKALAKGGLPRDVIADQTPPAPPNTQQLFDPANVELQRRMRFNPLRTVDPENLSRALDQFEIGILRDAALLWDAICKRDDTLTAVKPHLEESIASKDWGVFVKPNLPESQAKEAARHKACLEYFYDSITATDAFDRNERGGLPLVIKHMMRAHSFYYSTGHLVWKPEPGKMIDVEGASPAPVISAEIEHVPLWYFENCSGTLRFLPFGGFGITGQEMDWDGEWMVTVGRGVMFAASICYVFKRLTFQDWTIYNERYAQNKVVGQTTASADSPQGQAMASVLSNFNGDQAIVLYESQVTDKLPIQLLGPDGATSVDLFQRFLDRQDSKMTVMFRASDLSMMSKGGEGEKPLGASLQGDETDTLEKSCCRMVKGTANYYLDRQVIRYCFGQGIEPLAYFGLPDMDQEDVAEIRNSAGFLADRGVLVNAASVADRLGIELAENGEPALESIVAAASTDDPNAGKQADTTDVRDSLREDFTSNAAAPGYAVAVEKLLSAIDEGLRTANACSSEPRDEIGRWTADASAGVLKPEVARVMLKKGIDTKDVLGNSVRFDEGVLNHWDAEGHPEEEQDRRLRRLPDAVASVEHPHEVWKNDKQTAHLRAFQDEKSKRRYVAGFVTEAGKARTFFHGSRSTEVQKLRKGEKLYARPE